MDLTIGNDVTEHMLLGIVWRQSEGQIWLVIRGHWDYRPIGGGWNSGPFQAQKIRLE